MSYLNLSAFLFLLILLFVDGLETGPERTILTSTERRKEIEKIRDHELFGRHGEPVRRTNPQQRKLESERRAWKEQKKLSTVYDGDLGVKKEPQILRGAEDRLNDSKLIPFRNIAYIFVGFAGIFLFYKGYINRNRMLSNCRKSKQSV